ncbi:MAG TPA: hypothetical protein VGB37_16935, partial [Candidatus Lokiarchaeia archaeon]
SYRIILAGYYEEHTELLNYGWKAHKWTANRGYSNSKNNNREKECLFISPYCQKVEEQLNFL